MTLPSARPCGLIAVARDGGGVAVAAVAATAIWVVMASVMALGTKSRAERGAPAAQELAPLERPAFDPGRVASLLERGDLVFLELNGDTIARVSVALGARGSSKIESLPLVSVDDLLSSLE